MDGWGSGWINTPSNRWAKPQRALKSDRLGLSSDSSIYELWDLRPISWLLPILVSSVKRNGYFTDLSWRLTNLMLIKCLAQCLAQCYANRRQAWFLGASLSYVNAMTFVETHSQIHYPLAYLLRHHEYRLAMVQTRTTRWRIRRRPVGFSPWCPFCSLPPLTDDSNALFPLLELWGSCFNPRNGLFLLSDIVLVCEDLI